MKNVCVFDLFIYEQFSDFSLLRSVCVCMCILSTEGTNLLG